MKIKIAAFGAGLLFAMGLCVSGMTQPTKVVAFLDVFGAWDPSLAFVMGGAVIVCWASFHLIRRRNRPLLATEFALPSPRPVTTQLVAGSALFGVGWGMSGFCPGPAVVGCATGRAEVMLFVGCLLLGVWGHQLLERATSPRESAVTHLESPSS